MSNVKCQMSNIISLFLEIPYLYPISLEGRSDDAAITRRCLHPTTQKLEQESSEHHVVESEGTVHKAEYMISMTSKSTFSVIPTPSSPPYIGDSFTDTPT